jgi:hypothetical protein
MPAKATVPMTCKTCGKDFLAIASDVKRRGAKYCSYQCSCVKEPIEDRLWRRVDKSGDCWVWTGGRYRKGYGKFDALQYAHRVSWEIHNGPIPKGLYVLHKCDNPPCVRPDHLFLGTLADNNADMLTKGRYNTKLSEDQVAEIKRMLNTGLYSQQEIADSFGVNQTLISFIKRGVVWSRISPLE